MAIERDLIFSGEVDILKIGGSDMGATHGGVSVSMDSSYFETTCDQVLGIIGKKLTDRRCRVSFNLAEMELAVLQQVLAQPSGNLVGCSLGLSDGEQGTTTLEFEVAAPDGGGKWIYHFVIGYIVGSGEHSYTKDGQTVFAVEVECVVDSDNSNLFGYVYAEAS